MVDNMFTYACTLFNCLSTLDMLYMYISIKVMHTRAHDSLLLRRPNTKNVLFFQDNDFFFKLIIKITIEILKTHISIKVETF